MIQTQSMGEEFDKIDEVKLFLCAIVKRIKRFSAPAKYEVQSLEQDLGRWRSAAERFLDRHRMQVLSLENERIILHCQLLLLLEPASRMWLRSLSKTGALASLLHDCVKAIGNMLEGFKKAAFPPQSKTVWERGRVWVFEWQFASPRLPNLGAVFAWYGQEPTWECMVLAALVVYIMEVEGRKAGKLEDVVVDRIAVDNAARNGRIWYVRDVDGVVKRHEALVVWW